MPDFVVVGHNVFTDSGFSLNDLAGSTGRLDVLLRCVNSAFMLSNDIRRDVDMYLVLMGEPDPPKALLFKGCELKYLNPDERSTGALVKNALMKQPGKDWKSSTPGIYIARKSFNEVLECFRGRRLVHLKEEGQDAGVASLRVDDVFVLGGKYDLTEEEERAVSEWPESMMISLGPKSLHADHCITVVLNAVDNTI